MGKRRIMVWEYQCERCGHAWVPRLTFEPKICPSCKTPYWDRARHFPVSETRPAAKERGRPRQGEAAAPPARGEDEAAELDAAFDAIQRETERRKTAPD